MNEDTNMANETITSTPDTPRSLRELSEIYMQMSKAAYGPVCGKAFSDGALVMSLAAAVIEGKDVELDRLRTELVGARKDAKDAERYRHLRDKHVRKWVSDMPHNKDAPTLDIDFGAQGHDLDAAIDTAIAQVQP